MKEYKILTQKDGYFTGKFNPENLEKAINAYAKDGWVVKSACTADIASGMSNREEMIIILEREVKSAISSATADDVFLPSL